MSIEALDNSLSIVETSQKDNQNPICTVLLISYNHKKFFRNAIESVLAQKTKYKFLIRIFDDCSSDGTSNIVREYANRYPDMIQAHINEKNLGAQENIWNAYCSVQTKYCILLETDDYWTNIHKLERQINAMEKHPECSLCGHDVRFITLDERSREYQEGSLCCHQRILKKKRVFSLKDFWDIDDGGYIPYMSARLIRTEALELEKIRYKESVLFDFNQFYYLLLKGNYYYIDCPMSVYQRTGEGSCSQKPPLVTLDVYLQRVSEFNRQTDFIIAEKIYRECRLQIDHRLVVNKHYCSNAASRKLHNIMETNRDKLLIVSSIALGDTMILAGLKDEIEKKYGGKVHFIIRPHYKAVMELYGITDYTTIKDIDTIEFAVQEESGFITDRPKRGMLFMGHPIFYTSDKEKIELYKKLSDKRLTTDFMSFMKAFIGLDANCHFNAPACYPILSEQCINQLGPRYSPERSVMICPEAASMSELPISFWEEQVKLLQKQGYSVVVNTVKGIRIRGAKSANLTLSDAIAFASSCRKVISLRSGFCDLIAFACDDLTIYYPSYADLYIFSLNRMYPELKAEEKLHFVKTNLVSPPLNGHQHRPYIFGIIPAPQWVYRFYLKHKDKLYRFVKYIKWK